MRLSQLIDGLPVQPVTPAPLDPEVGGIAHDSRRVAPGDLFVAWRGARFDGAAYAPQAVERGAVAVLADRPDPGSADRTPVPGSVPWLTAADPHALLGALAVRVYGHPHRDLLLAGITGTNGKSTVAAVLASILDAAGRPAGLLGTLGYRFRDAVDESGRTTPEASDLLRILRRMHDAGAEAAAMEVSSHALALGRVEAIGFDLAVFTNLTQDHLDFHADLEDYYDAKRSLFDLLEPGGGAAVNVDDPWGRRLAAELEEAGVRRVTFGEGADVRVLAADLEARRTRATVATPVGELALVSPLIGRFNLSNLLAAVAGAVALDLPLAAIAAGIAAQPPVPGRLEPVDRGQDFSVYLDFAHTPEALRAVLTSLSELSDPGSGQHGSGERGGSKQGGGERIVVFGCGGDRDRSKRPIMGRIAGELADRPIVTTDNPRTEDPQSILDQIEAGLRESGNRAYEVVPDRREAIRRAVAVARPGSVLLVAGRGHETHQLVGTEARPFSDRDEIAAAIAATLAAHSTGDRPTADRPTEGTPGALDRG